MKNIGLEFSNFLLILPVVICVVCVVCGQNLAEQTKPAFRAEIIISLSFVSTIELLGGGRRFPYIIHSVGALGKY